MAVIPILHCLDVRSERWELFATLNKWKSLLQYIGKILARQHVFLKGDATTHHFITPMQYFIDFSRQSAVKKPACVCITSVMSGICLP